MNQDQYDVFPTGISEIEFSELHQKLVDSFLTALVGKDGLAKINEAFGIPEDFNGTTEDGHLDAPEFIRIATAKLHILQRLAHEAMVRSITASGPLKRHKSGGGPSPQALDNARRWLKGHSFTLPEIKARHPEADPEAHRYGVVGRPPVFGATVPFDCLDGLDLSEFEEKPNE